MGTNLPLLLPCLCAQFRRQEVPWDRQQPVLKGDHLLPSLLTLTSLLQLGTAVSLHASQL